MRTTARALLALSLLAGFYLLLAGVVVADLTVLVLLVTLPAPPGTATIVGIPANAMYPIGLSAPLLAAICYGVFAVSRPRGPLSGSVPLMRAEAGELRETVEQLAEQVGAPAPTEIRLIGEANALVTEESVMLGLFAGRNRILYIGAPLLVALSAQELRAVLCHELGHYARRHTRLAAVVYRGAAALQSTIEQLREASGTQRFTPSYARLLLAVLSVYARLYRRISLAVNRRQELEADAAAARIAGAEATGEALRAAHAVAVSWAAFSTQLLGPARRSGRMPDDPFSAYQALLQDPGLSEELARLKAEVPQEPDSRLDTHPGLATRLRALSGYPSPPADRDQRPALELLTEHKSPFFRLVRFDVLRAGPRPLPWQEWLATVAESRGLGPARALRRVVNRLSGRAPAQSAEQPLLAEVLDLLAAGRGVQLAASLAAGAPGAADAGSGLGDGDRRLLLEALYSLVGQALAGTGAAAWRLSWAGASVLVPRGIPPGELAGLLAEAVRDPAEVARLRLHLAALGVDENAPVSLGEPGDPAPGTSQVTPLTDPGYASWNKRFPVRGTATMVGLLLALGVIANVAAAKRHPAPPLAAYPTFTYQSPVSPFFPQPSISLPVINPSLVFASLPTLPSDTTIVVRPGDSLGAIAKRCHSTVAQLQKLNNLGASTAIRAGQKLNVPAIDGLLLPVGCD